MRQPAAGFAALRQAGWLAILPMALLAGCSNDADPGPGGVTIGEARALDEAAAMLDSQRLPEDALEEPDDGAAPAEEEAPAESGTEAASSPAASETSAQ